MPAPVPPRLLSGTPRWVPGAVPVFATAEVVTAAVPGLRVGDGGPLPRR